MISRRLFLRGALSTGAAVAVVLALPAPAWFGVDLASGPDMPVLALMRDSCSPAASDLLGVIEFRCFVPGVAFDRVAVRWADVEPIEWKPWEAEDVIEDDLEV